MLHAIMYEKIDIPENGEFIKIQGEFSWNIVTGSCPQKFQLLKSCVRNGISRASI